MSGIRSLREEDLEPVAVVYEQAARSGRSKPPPGLASAIGRIFLDAPFEGSACPAIVHEDADGRIDAFMGIIVRRMRFGDEILRIGVTGPMVVAPDTSSTAVGVKLDRHAMTFGYDILLTDGASRDAHAVWTRLGGFSTPVGSFHWTRRFSPATDALDELARRPKLTRRVIAQLVAAPRPLAKGADAVRRRWAGKRMRRPPAVAEAEELGVEELLAGLNEIGSGMLARPDYDRATLTWLFRELRSTRSRGELRGHLLRGGKHQVLGWYLYHCKRGGRSQVLQVAARPRAMEAVVDHLVEDAENGGSLSLEGRAEPELLEPLAAHDVRYRYGPPLALIQTRRSDFLAALYSGKALLTRLEGEWWMALHEELYEEGVLRQ